MMKLVLLLLGFVWSQQALAGHHSTTECVTYACIIAPCEVPANDLPCKQFYPNATCTNNYCNGCHAIWRTPKEKVIKCDPCAFPKCEPNEMVNCVVNPCKFAKKPDCKKGKNAVCISNSCGGCNAVWVNKKGRQLSKKCNCIDCFGKWTVEIMKEKCKDCTCADLRAKGGKGYVRKACKKYMAIRKMCCTTCMWAKS